MSVIDETLRKKYPGITEAELQLLDDLQIQLQEVDNILDYWTRTRNIISDTGRYIEESILKRVNYVA
jgi:hypothetical protein